MGGTCHQTEGGVLGQWGDIGSLMKSLSGGFSRLGHLCETLVMWTGNSSSGLSLAAGSLVLQVDPASLARSRRGGVPLGQW